ncbi:TIGR04255 family protein [Mycobacterium crocinum]|uniref:TIGR04255 family protein n=1 Tax=Mycolicibacterium crocinum TaxID=388459 RepID=A0ABY3TJI1_9MYCO|nr:TIGR04255 family protein [Mycolicibacterium crocinum]MCV7215532.1 TIGR04255 family protein [Mycolicibacterium crocinum]ULN40032.1 TIGR04255 family protein [Mycolicibacterium crocinum]
MYPNAEAAGTAAVVAVIAEVRFTDAPRLRQQETLDAVAIAVEGRFPVTEPLTGVNLAPAGPGLPPRVEPRQGVLLRNAEATESLTLTATSLSYETTNYTGLDAIQTAITAGCDALVDANVASGLQRVGLRYIDEIRVPQPPTDARGWSTWIDGSLLGPLAIAPDQVPSRGIQGVAAFDLGGRAGLNVQYAAFANGSATLPQHLRRRPFQAGPFFGLDLDGFYEVGNEEFVRLDAGIITDILAKLHAPISSAFQRAITDDARALYAAVSAGPNGATRHRDDPLSGPS